MTTSAPRTTICVALYNLPRSSFCIVTVNPHNHPAKKPSTVLWSPLCREENWSSKVVTYAKFTETQSSATNLMVFPLDHYCCPTFQGLIQVHKEYCSTLEGLTLAIPIYWNWSVFILAGTLHKSKEMSHRAGKKNRSKHGEMSFWLNRTLINPFKPQNKPRVRWLGQREGKSTRSGKHSWRKVLHLKAW